MKRCSRSDKEERAGWCRWREHVPLHVTHTHTLHHYIYIVSLAGGRQNKQKRDRHTHTHTLHHYIYISMRCGLHLVNRHRHHCSQDFSFFHGLGFGRENIGFVKSLGLRLVKSLEQLVSCLGYGFIKIWYRKKFSCRFFSLVTHTALLSHQHDHHNASLWSWTSCYMGNSRCATIAAAYLMIKKDYSATQALQYMRNSRLILMKFSILLFMTVGWLCFDQRGPAQPWFSPAAGGEG